MWTDELLNEWERVIVREKKRTASSARSVTATVRQGFASTRLALASSFALRAPAHTNASCNYSYEPSKLLVMSITVEELATRFKAEAARRGISAEELLDELAANAAPPRRKLGFVSLGASTSGRSAADTDEMLADGFGRSRT